MKSANNVIYPGVDTIRRIQELVVLCALLPPDGTLRKVLEKALALHEEPLLARITPQTGLHPFEAKSWLEALWGRDDLSAAERELVDWQNDTDSMTPALHELQNAEEQMGVVLAAQLLDKQQHHLRAAGSRDDRRSE
ncbi:DurN family substrate-assisted peptide maturase [Streptomyces gamaensis]|uniref:DurN family substrate-assisted peptide maturase n=1 Tax=Streptomyces gamaensis TaxID=1763542 RepID=A0ABW0Z7N9_9ACTN